jgi:hypothetical protein
MSSTKTKLAVAIVHGIGEQAPGFAATAIEKMRTLFASAIEKHSERPEEEIIFEPVYWAPVLEEKERDLKARSGGSGRFRYEGLRDFMIHFAADAIAYQPDKQGSQTYEEIHAVFAMTLRKLRDSAGPEAPLAVISHSLGTIIASNFLYDLERDREAKSGGLIPGAARGLMSATPLEWGETLARFFTLGSPLALWALRYNHFGCPLTVPHPKLIQHYPHLQAEWINFYDRSDVIGYPLKTLSELYDRSVTSDVPVNVGGLLRFWNPLSHVEYLGDHRILQPIARSLAKAWRGANDANS